MSTLEMPHRVAVVGGGLIGVSWAALFQAGGCDVRLWDPSDAARAQAPVGIAHALAQLKTLGMDQPGSLRVCGTLAQALEGADWVQENAPEKIELKQNLLAEIERLAPASAVIASSTSSLVWSAMSQKLQSPGRLIVAHPFNPPHLIPLVELYGIANDHLDLAMRFYTSLRRAPIRLRKEAMGHVANRLSSALWREAVHIVAEGIASVEDVDQALVNGPGLRWSVQGTHLSYHLGGGAGGISHYLAHLGPSQAQRWKDLGDPALTPEVCALLVEGVMAEAAGRSVGQLEAERDAKLMALLQSRQTATPNL